MLHAAEIDCKTVVIAAYKTKVKFSEIKDVTEHLYTAYHMPQLTHNPNELT